MNAPFNANCNWRIGTVALVSLMVPNAPPPAVGTPFAPATFQLLCAMFVFGSPEIRAVEEIERLNPELEASAAHLDVLDGREIDDEDAGADERTAPDVPERAKGVHLKRRHALWFFTGSVKTRKAPTAAPQPLSIR